MNHSLCTEEFISCVSKGVYASHKLCEHGAGHLCIVNVNTITLATPFSTPIINSPAHSAHVMIVAIMHRAIIGQSSRGHVAVAAQE